MQFLVFIFHYVKILAALYRGFLGCVLPCEFSVLTYCILYKAIGSPRSEYLLIWDVSADHALFSGGTPGVALRVLQVHHRGADGLLQFLRGLCHLLVLADIIQRPFYWFVVAKIQPPASFLAAQVAKPGGQVA